MIFSNAIFIFGVLPITIIIYYLLKKWRTAQNVWLFLISIFFYAWGEPKLVLLMLISIFANYIFGLLVNRYRTQKSAKWILTAAVICNISGLFIFKYLGFVLENISYMGSSVEVIKFALPIGISFYTFQAMSYVIDVYRGDGEVQKNPLNVGLYIAFFPQLIAGPIVRYETVAKQIETRIESIDDFAYGIKRFVYGLCKKLMLANSFAVIADYIFGNIGEMSCLTAWIGALSYTFQIFFDFSGYSDMAIGLGRMFGFHFLENFNYPYISRSVSEFWRRWHMSLGSWFRDYVYIPLGGSRVGKYRLIFNLFIVWLLTGIWHGANWTFILWGIWYFTILCFEKVSGFPKRFKTKVSKLFYAIWTFLSVMIGWVLFRSETVNKAGEFLKVMFGMSGNFVIDDIGVFLIKDMWLLIGIAVLVSTPIVNKMGGWFEKRNPVVYCMINCGIVVALFMIAIGFSVTASYNPFIYFNF